MLIPLFPLMVLIVSDSDGASKVIANRGSQQPATEERRIPSAPFSFKKFSNSLILTSIHSLPHKLPASYLP